MSATFSGSKEALNGEQMKSRLIFRSYYIIAPVPIHCPIVVMLIVAITKGASSPDTVAEKDVYISLLI